MTRQRSIEGPAPIDLLADVLRECRGQTSLEHFRLSGLPAMFVLRGMLLSRGDAAPEQAHYMVSGDRDWVTRSVHVTTIEGQRMRRRRGVPGRPRRR